MQSCFEEYNNSSPTSMYDVGELYYVCSLLLWSFYWLIILLFFLPTHPHYQLFNFADSLFALVGFFPKING